MTQSQVQQTFHIKQHDTDPNLYFTVYDGDTPVDLTTALSVRFLMSSLSHGLVINNSSNVTLFDQTLHPGEGTYRFQVGDTDISGEFKAEIEITWAGSRRQTWPSKGYIKVKIAPDLG